MSMDKWTGIDSHIHLDLYTPPISDAWIASLKEDGVLGLVAVSMDLESCQRVQQLHERYRQHVYPAYGFHPEQPITSEQQRTELFGWMRSHQSDMVAIGEVGLPYYLRREREAQGDGFAIEPYVELLEAFVQLAAEWNKPIVLHAVYEDAITAIELLEKYSIAKAHFHWFKGDQRTVERMIANGYSISFTPDICYEADIQQIASSYPIELTMVETDGPWPFEGRFTGRPTHPRMLKSVVYKLAKIKGLCPVEVSKQLIRHTKAFYGLD